MPTPKRNPKHDDAFQNRPDLTQIMHFSPQVPIAAPFTQLDVAGPSALQSKPSAPQITLILGKEKRIIQVTSTSESDIYSVRSKQ